jgi:hypothetical protein
MRLNLWSRKGLINFEYVIDKESQLPMVFINAIQGDYKGDFKGTALKIDTKITTRLSFEEIIKLLYAIKNKSDINFMRDNVNRNINFKFEDTYCLISMNKVGVKIEAIVLYEFLMFGLNIAKNQIKLMEVGRPNVDNNNNNNSNDEVANKPEFKTLEIGLD